MTDNNPTIPAPPPDDASLPDVVRAELERYRAQVLFREYQITILERRIKELEADGG